MVDADTLMDRIESLARENGRLEAEANAAAAVSTQRIYNLETNSRKLASDYAQGLFNDVLAQPSNKIRLIKLHRAIFNSGLREAKHAIEASELYRAAAATAAADGVAALHAHDGHYVAQWSPPGV
jgi:ribosomal protein L7/L12